ncbi:MAG: phosphotransferase [Rhodospirillales bacterium]|nr:phosphotransferase [Rhodospirillales bacterium]MCB9996054.1 phosphotransferase [Rhodospirillales bacterium]
MSLLAAENWFDDRDDARSDFLSKAGWENAELTPVGEDCAFRRYFRLTQDEKTAILMEAVPEDSEIATPGHKLSDFVRIDWFLRGVDLNVPEIYKADVEAGYALLEDFGDTSFQKALAVRDRQQELYELATDVLIRLREDDRIVLPHYNESHVHKARQRIVDWYIPAVRKKENPEGLVESYLAVWQEIERSLPPCPQGFVHVDFHVENLMWLPDRDGLSRCGILDFQGAMHGPLPYDLANLLEDARRDVPKTLRQDMMERYTAGMSPMEKSSFMAWYRVLATQFHCRVAGQFIRLALRDGKGGYLKYLSRVTTYLREGLQAPVLKPMQDWFTAEGIDFKTSPKIDPKELKPLIAEDAF